MASLVESTEADGGTLLIEVDYGPRSKLGWSDDHRAVKAERVAGTAKGLFDSGVGAIGEAARSVTRQLKALSDDVRPNEMTVEFGVQLDAELGAIVVKGSGGAHLTVSLTWRQDATGGGAQPAQPTDVEAAL
jgi:Trypsin-co-occurring domain 1